MPQDTDSQPTTSNLPLSDGTLLVPAIVDIPASATAVPVPKTNSETKLFELSENGSFGHDVYWSAGELSDEGGYCTYGEWQGARQSSLRKTMRPDSYSPLPPSTEGTFGCVLDQGHPPTIYKCGVKSKDVTKPQPHLAYRWQKEKACDAGKTCRATGADGKGADCVAV